MRWVPLFQFLFWVLPTNLLLFGATTIAHERIRPTALSELKGVYQEFVDLRKASLLWVNYGAMKRDFPALSHLADSGIDKFIMDNFAFINANQLLLNGLRVRFPKEGTGDKRVKFLVPPGYNRAAVAQGFLADGKFVGLVDLKGTGLTGQNNKQKVTVQDYRVLQEQLAKGELSPSNLKKLLDVDHSDGVMSAGEALAEIVRQLAIQAGFDIVNLQKGTRFETVESYFAIDTGLSILRVNSKTGEIFEMPSAIYGRQPSFRTPYSNGALNGPLEYSRVYLDKGGGFQKTTFESAIDFGASLLRFESFANRFGALAGADPQFSSDWSSAHEVAERFRRDHQRRTVDQFVYDMISPVFSHSLWAESQANKKLDKATLWDAVDLLQEYLDKLKDLNRSARPRITVSGFESYIPVLLNTALGRRLQIENPNRFEKLLLGSDKTSNSSLKCSKLFGSPGD